MKGHKLWCTKEDSPDFIFSIDGTFDESALFQKRSERSILEKDLDVV